MARICINFFAAIAILALVDGAFASQAYYDKAAFDEAFKGAQVIDLRTIKVSSVVKLRDVVKIPPPSDPVYVKVFPKKSLPAVLKPAFEKPNIVGVTIDKRYVAILKTEFPEEYKDTLAHELVHAYISQVSPKPLDFAFQEASAVHFSIDKVRKFYGQPSKTQVGVMVGKTVEIADVYKQKLHYFQYLVDKLGEKKFDEWYRNAVISGDTDAKPILGIKHSKYDEANEANKAFPMWMIVLIGAVVLVVVAVGFYSVWQNSEEV